MEIHVAGYRLLIAMVAFSAIWWTCGFWVGRAYELRQQCKRDWEEDTKYYGHLSDHLTEEDPQTPPHGEQKGRSR